MKSWHLGLISLLFSPDYILAAGAPDADALIKSLGSINKSPLTCTINPKLEYVCEDMAKLSCTDGTFNDGTGITLSEADYQKKIAPKKLKVESLYQNSINEMLNTNSEKHNLTRALAIKASGQENTPDCVSNKKNDRKKCYAQVAKILATKEATVEFPIESRSAQKTTKTGIDFASYISLTSNQSYIDAMAKAHKKSFKVVSEEKLNEKIEGKIFPRVKALLLKKIENSDADEKTKQHMKDKINNITYAGNDCPSLIGNAIEHTSLSGLTVENAFYSPKSQTFRFCNGYLLKSNSEFMIAAIIAHELSHAIDPCNLPKPIAVEGFNYKNVSVGEDISNIEAQFPWKGVLGCLRSTESVGALRVKTNQTNSNSKVFEKSEIYSGAFCGENDQIGESFSDWMAAELTPQYINQHHPRLSDNEKVIGYSNLKRVYCDPNESRSSFDEHPMTKDRINRIFMANPEIRKQVGCGEPKNGLHYCKQGEVFTGTRATPSASATPPVKGGMSGGMSGGNP